jgi:hypothetical protein
VKTNKQTFKSVIFLFLFQEPLLVLNSPSSPAQQSISSDENIGLKTVHQQVYGYKATNYLVTLHYYRAVSFKRSEREKKAQGSPRKPKERKPKEAQENPESPRESKGSPWEPRDPKEA